MSFSQFYSEKNTRNTLKRLKEVREGLSFLPTPLLHGRNEFKNLIKYPLFDVEVIKMRAKSIISIRTK